MLHLFHDQDSQDIKVFPSSNPPNLEEVPLFSDMFNYIFEPSPLPSIDIIPNGLLVSSSNFYAFSRPPEIKRVTISYSDKDGASSGSSYKAQYSIPVPWHIYAFNVVYNEEISRYFIDKIYIFWTFGEPTINSNLYFPLYLNLYTDYHICPPNFSSVKEMFLHDDSLKGLYNQAYDTIWSSNWNFDIMPVYQNVFTFFEKFLDYKKSSPDNDLFYFLNYNHCEYVDFKFLIDILDLIYQDFDALKTFMLAPIFGKVEIFFKFWEKLSLNHVASSLPIYYKKSVSLSLRSLFSELCKDFSNPPSLSSVSNKILLIDSSDV